MMMGKKISHTYEEIISVENLLVAWEEFIRGKRHRLDVQLFSRALLSEVLQLHEELSLGTYCHGAYRRFRISDPKPRVINKASVRDRLLHRAIYRVLYPAIDPTFIHDNYSCRDGKGMHRGFARLVTMARKISRNYTGSCWGLKLDIRKYFDSIDHQLLLEALAKRIADQRVVDLLRIIIESFSMSPGKGMPLGNLTSQLFANLYLDPLDTFVKHQLKVTHYLRYADDVVLLSSNPNELLGYFVEINQFVKRQLQLEIHPNKVVLRKLRQGIDFVGYVALPRYQVPRRKTVRRMVRRALRLVHYQPEQLATVLPSYLGYLKHIRGYGWEERLAGTLP